MTRSAWLWGAAWVAVVVIGGGLAWVAIERAGHEVAGTSGLPVTAPRDDLTSTAGADSTQTAAPSASVTRTPGTSPSPRPSSGSSSPGTSPGTSPGPTSGSSSGVRTVVRTWTGSAGRVTASCTGERARLVGASPANGWVVDRIEEDEVDVRFERAEQEVEVHMRCENGTPRFEVESKD